MEESYEVVGVTPRWVSEYDASWCKCPVCGAAVFDDDAGSRCPGCGCDIQECGGWR